MMRDFAADRDFKDKLERLAEVLGVENGRKHIANILEKALGIALEKKTEEARAAEEARKFIES